MLKYTWDQIQILFYLYCFLGWVWECCFVSIRKGEWVNRGFLYGPALPIYGFGALIILLITYPVEDSLALIFIFGMIGATALEFVTGALMERLFHLRYWDYSKNPCNLHGYICLSCSLGWGCFSVLLVKFINPPVESLLYLIPDEVMSPLGTVLTVIISVDTVKSAQAAINLRELMEKMSEQNAAFGAARARMEELSATIDERWPELHERVTEASAKRREQAEQNKEKRERLLRQTGELLRESRRDAEALAFRANATLRGLDERLPDCASAEERESMQGVRNALNQLIVELHRLQVEAVEKKDKELERAESLLKRNPTMSSQNFKEAIGELRERIEAEKK